jgi:hypothetical protein
MITPIKNKQLENTVLDLYIGNNVVALNQYYLNHLNTEQVHKLLMEDHGIKVEMGHMSARKLVIDLSLTGV